MSDTERLSTKTERALEALGEGMTSRPNQRPAASPSQRPKEKVGAGTDYAAENRKRLGAQLKTKIKAAEKSGNVAAATKLRKDLARLLTQKT